jgi:hypothetical protein
VTIWRSRSLSSSGPARARARRGFARVATNWPISCFVVRGDSIAVARGKPNSDIAGELFLSEATVKTHITRTFAKLDVSNRVQLTIFAYEAGLVTP